jgi:hypothetical protein
MRTPRFTSRRNFLEWSGLAAVAASAMIGSLWECSGSEQEQKAVGRELTVGKDGLQNALTGKGQARVSSDIPARGDRKYLLMQLASPRNITLLAALGNGSSSHQDGLNQS